MPRRLVRACSHEPGTVNYPGAIIGPASVTSCSHDDLLSRGNVAPGQLHCPEASSSKSDHYEFIWIPLVFTQIVTENDFKHVYLFLLLSGTFFIGKFILNINNEHAQDYSCPRATFAFCSHGEKLPRQGGLPGVVQRVTLLSKLPRGNEKLMWTVTGVRPCTETKLTPGSVSCPGVMSCPGIMWTGP